MEQNNLVDHVGSNFLFFVSDKEPTRKERTDDLNVLGKSKFQSSGKRSHIQ